MNVFGESYAQFFSSWGRVGMIFEVFVVVLMDAYGVSYAQIFAVICGRVFCEGRTLMNVRMAIL